jgi:RNA polymerase sigma-70 factor (ECF subfamily)
MASSEEKIITGCKKGKRRSQLQLYKVYAPVLLATAMRYTKNKSEAEDVLQEALVKIYGKIDSYTSSGSFEGWLKRIVVNTALNHNRANQKFSFMKDLDDKVEFEVGEELSDENKDVQFSKETLLGLVQELPEGYKMVFNLYVFEEYSHKEIAKTLNINENTSKSQLFKARRVLKKKLIELTKNEEALMSEVLR